jgi:hypothetical protein
LYSIAAYWHPAMCVHWYCRVKTLRESCENSKRLALINWLWCFRQKVGAVLPSALPCMYVQRSACRNYPQMAGHLHVMLVCVTQTFSVMFNDSLATTKRRGVWQYFHLFAMKLPAQLTAPVIYKCKNTLHDAAPHCPLVWC